MYGKIIKEALTFDDVLLVPAKSNILPYQVVLKTKLTKRINLNIPILSAAMDTVTEHRLASALALQGGLGIIHKNFSVQQQAQEVLFVKENQVDIDKFPEACLDESGRLRVGAAVGIDASAFERVEALLNEGVDVLSVDSAHGHSQGVIQLVREIKKRYPSVELIGGNIVTQEAAKELIEAGADALKVGVGPGSICTTRVIAGVGVPQLTAINDVYSYAKRFDVGVIGDGGIRLSGDIVKALASGANCVMLGGVLAGTEEAPGDDIIYNGQKFKTYAGMGSLAAMKRGSKDRYFQAQQESKKLVPEGIEGRVPYKGMLEDIVYQLCGGIRAGMGYCGAETIENLIEKGKFVKITNSGLRESHPHGVQITKEAPNY